MLRSFCTAVFCLLLLASEGQSLANEVIVQLFQNAQIGKLQEDLLLNDISFSKITPVSKRLNIWLVHLNPSVSAATALQFMNTEADVANAQLNHHLEYRTIPSDADFSQQWNMVNNGGGGIPDADIDADEAWNISTGGLTAQGDTIVIAIVDDGFDLANEDLDYWKNYADIPGNGIDDDGNGYIDDYNGWNTFDTTGNITTDFHGTHVSGIAGAIGNNGIGIAGVDMNVKIMPVQADAATADDVEVLMAYTYIFQARELYNQTNGAKGAFVVATNTSFGIDLGNPDDSPIWCALYDTLGKAGILSAAATTNLHINVDILGDMPTGCPSDYLIAVTNTNKFDQLNSSGYGATTVDLGAPGYLIYSTMPDNNYGPLTGTSMASPHLAGTVALMMAAACDQFIQDYKTDPGAKALELKNYILQSVDPLADLNGITVSNGRLNLFTTLKTFLSGYCDLPVHETPSPELFHVFPDPAATTIFIILAGQIDCMSITIFDAIGRKVFEENKITSEMKNNGIDVSEFATGVYFIHVTDTENNLIGSATFVKQ